jgi:hypothetical protein
MSRDSLAGTEQGLANDQDPFFQLAQLKREGIPEREARELLMSRGHDTGNLIDPRVDVVGDCRRPKSGFCS